MSTSGKKDWTDKDDNTLALALQSGDESAYDELVRRHQKRVYAVAYRLTGNREDALDVAQDALLKAYQKIDAWKPTGGFLPWLLRLTANQAIDYLRRRKRRREEQFDNTHHEDRDADIVEPVQENTPMALDAKEIDARVQKALPLLSPAQRTVFVLRHYQGLALSEIAEQMGCTVGSVKVHLFRALKKLRQELKDFEGYFSE